MEIRTLRKTINKLNEDNEGNSKKLLKINIINKKICKYINIITFYQFILQINFNNISEINNLLNQKILIKKNTIEIFLYFIKKIFRT